MLTEETISTAADNTMKVMETFSLSESQAIMKYIMNKHFSSSTHPLNHLYPSQDLRVRAKVDEYLDWNHVGLRQITNRYAHLYYFDLLKGEKIDTKG